ncbi:MAG: CRISPR-associated endonuclease Cas1 [Saprospiraceae bacterium]|nr:CRISPR-associated endonuclease Cas1 [Saprospiraceae bacterium]
MQLVLNTPGLALRVRGGAFEAVAGDQRRPISPEQISSIAVTAGCMLSSAAIELAASAEIPIYIFDETGDAVACMRSPYFESLATLRRKQVYFSDAPEGGAWVLEQFKLKTGHQIEMLEHLAERRPAQKEVLQQKAELLVAEVGDLDALENRPVREWRDELMGWEGNQARTYWQALSDAMPEAWRFEKRSRRPALDPFNAVINYHYGMLYGVVEQALFAAGLDPHLGILHVDEYDRPTLAFDLIEPFRPWIDRLVVDLFLDHKVEIAFFDDRNPGFFLNAAGKRLFIPAFNEWMSREVRWRNMQLDRTAQIFRSAAELARYIDETMQRP